MVKIIITECEGEKVSVINADVDFDKVKGAVAKSVHTLFNVSHNSTDAHIIDYIKERYADTYKDMIASGVFTDASIAYAINESVKMTKERRIDAIDRLFGQIEGDDKVCRSIAIDVMVMIANRYNGRK